jgi:hypothetical protein
MGIAVHAPRGGLVEKLASQPRAMILRNAEIERFEDRHKSIFEAWDGFMGRAPQPTATVVRDLVALGLIGAGMADTAADALVAAQGPDQLQHLQGIARGLIGVAFMPDLPDAGGDELGKNSPDTSAGDGGGDPGKKPQPEPGTFGE